MIESEIPNRRSLVGQFRKIVAVKESQEYSQDMICNISLTGAIVVFIVENFTFLSDMLFSLFQVTDCYMKLSSWSEVAEWQKHVGSLRKQCSDPNIQHALMANIDMNYVK